MFFKKPNGITYTQMAMYVDENVYKPEFDENLIFQYLYHLFYILAVKKCYFKTSVDYDNYGLYGAEETYRRLTNPKQFLPDSDPKKLPKIKSCLNYIKSILYALKVNYQNSQFREVISKDVLKDNNIFQLEKDLSSKARNMFSEQARADTEYYLKKITHTIKNYLKDIPYASNKEILKNIYLSCLLTLLSNITWSNSNKEKIQNRLSKRLNIDETLNKVYEEESQDLILWHLEPSMKNYIKTLMNKIKSLIRKDLRELIGSNEPTDQIIKSIIASPLGEISIQDGDDEY